MKDTRKHLNQLYVRMEVDHIIPKSRGGKDNYGNWQLLHVHCHDQKTTEDNSLILPEVPMTSANPDELKGTCPVLEPERRERSRHLR